MEGNDMLGLAEIRLMASLTRSGNGLPTLHFAKKYALKTAFVDQSEAQ
jgi:hypothetical protein